MQILGVPKSSSSPKDMAKEVSVSRPVRARLILKVNRWQLMGLTSPQNSRPAGHLSFSWTLNEFPPYFPFWPQKWNMMFTIYIYYIYIEILSVCPLCSQWTWNVLLEGSFCLRKLCNQFVQVDWGPSWICHKKIFFANCAVLFVNHKRESWLTWSTHRLIFYSSLKNKEKTIVKVAGKLNQNDSHLVFTLRCQFAAHSEPQFSSSDHKRYANNYADCFVSWEFNSLTYYLREQYNKLSEPFIYGHFGTTIIGDISAIFTFV